MHSETRGEQASPAAWYALGVLVAVMLLRMVDQVALNVGIEPMRKELGLNDLQLGLLHGIGVTMAAALGGIPLAWLADRFGHMRVLAICIIAWSAATAARTFAQNFTHVMTSTVGMSIAEAALMPIAYALIPRLFRGRHLATANLIFYACSALGFSVAMMLTGKLFLLIGQHPEVLPPFLRGLDPWRTTSFAFGIIGPAFALLVLGIRGASAGRTASDIGSEVGVAVYLRAHWRALAAVYGSSALGALALGPLMVWIAPALIRRFNLEPGEVAQHIGAVFLLATTSGIALSAVLNRLYGGKLGRALPVRMGPVLTVVSSLSLATLLVLDSLFGIYAAIFVAMMALIGFNALMPTVYQAITPSHLRARVMAALISLITMATAMGPIVVGYVSDTIPKSANSLLIACAAMAVPFTLASAAVLRWGTRSVESTMAAMEAEEEQLVPQPRGDHHPITLKYE